MALDPRFIVAPSIQQLFRDKDTGLPLSGGKVYFFEDSQRTVPKPVYQLSGVVPNYTYVPLPNPVILDSVGAFPEIIYYFPFDALGNVQLYYISVFSSDNVFQFDVEAYPNFSSGGMVEDVDANFIPNGQFTLHTNLPEDNTYDAGRVRQNITDVAYGGWTFETNFAAGAEDFVTFERFNSFSTFPLNSPRYAIKVETTSPMTVLSKDLRVKFNNVNRFSSDTDEQYTFGFSARDNNAVTTSVKLVLIKNFGTGGSPSGQEEIDITTFTVNPSYQTFSVPFSFGENAAKVIGTNDDDFIQLALRFPLDSSFSVSLTDAFLLVGDKPNDDYPVTTTSQDIYRSLAGFIKIPDYNSNDLGLPLILTKSGIDYERGLIGSYLWKDTTTRPFGYLPFDGSMYESTEINATDGIPYSRLHSFLFNTTTNLPLYGTGDDYSTLIYDGVANEAFLMSNKAALVGAVANGSISTGFTFRRIHTSLASPAYGIKCNQTASNIFQIINNEYELVIVPTVGTSTFTLQIFRTSFTDVGVVGGIQEISRWTTIAAATLGSLYFTFTSTIATVPTSYYVWFTVNGAGADPAVPGHTGIQINLETADSSAIVAQKIMASLNGYEVNNILFVAGAAIPAGSSFNFDSTSNYYVWYTVDGAGVDPAPVGRSGIKVAVLTTDTAAQVAFKTQKEINSKFFKIEDLRGLFPRIFNNGASVDVDASTRQSMIPGYFGDKLGTTELDSNLSHKHPPQEDSPNFTSSVANGEWAAGGGGESFAFTGHDGGREGRPKNFVTNVFIKY